MSAIVVKYGARVLEIEGLGYHTHHLADVLEKAAEALRMVEPYYGSVFVSIAQERRVVDDDVWVLRIVEKLSQ